MIRGLYTAAKGMMTEAARQETITNNLVNSETTGFKKDLAVLRAPERSVVRVGDAGGRTVIGTLGLGPLVDRLHTSHDQGDLRETGRSLDLALSGEGFFVVETPGGWRHTRNGAFTLDADRYLVDDHGQRVQGTNGPLQVAAGEVQIDVGGRVVSDGVPQGQLRIESFADSSQLQKVGRNLFAADAALEAIPFNGQVHQGFLESSNVQVLQEMVRMLTAQRAYETNQRVLLAQDELLGKAVNEVGVVR